ncbi:Rrf2 family transcriptional regulator [Paenibacillus rhizovicinus]|uniref:Rrf2 family transcriptional regulator n=1 Tax=Paenibacillus rhizovicinus TaxID=2704463 RepID=A0A6C0P8W1_9BACL|nr:Rrf2 family transcriptional regulator [Paenibacillus rhizovicinus]QHW34063.1 Rrf2 family transcriptional regulator [Paenibacillus rhizovicinus]
MAQLKRFGLGLQALIVLATNDDLRSSAEIAEQIRCEPTALRKILAQLGDAGIVEVRQGRSGGYELTRSPEAITLFEVYTSLHDEQPVWDRMLDTTGDHGFGQRVNESFQTIMSEINIQVTKVLGNFTVADLMKS